MAAPAPVASRNRDNRGPMGGASGLKATRSLNSENSCACRSMLSGRPM